jgi:hypothetical protein
MPQSLTIRVIVFRDSGLWVARGLEYDIGAQAPDLDTLHARFEAALEAEMQMSLEDSGVPFAGVEPAPERFHEMWKQRSRTFVASRPRSSGRASAAQRLLHRACGWLMTGHRSEQSQRGDISFDMGLCA